MSKTDRTVPYRIALMYCEHRRIYHHHRCDGVNCDADNTLLHYSNLPRWPICGWEFPADDYHGTYRMRYGRKSNRFERRKMWYGPSRTEECAALREAVKEYRANGDVDHVELSHQQHRHQTDWDLD